MEEQLKQIQNKVGVLNNWIEEMKVLVENPYSSGLNTDRMLRDLGGFAKDLGDSIAQLIALEPEPEKLTDSATVEQ